MNADQNPYESPRSAASEPPQSTATDGQLGNTIGSWVCIGLGGAFCWMLLPAVWGSVEGVRYEGATGATLPTTLLAVFTAPHVFRMRKYRRPFERPFRAACVMLSCVLPLGLLALFWLKLLVIEHWAG